MLNDRREPTSILNRSFITLFFANMAFNMGQFMSNALLPVYVDSLGAPAAVIGLVVSTFGFAAILFRFVSSPIMDTYNRKYIVAFASLLMVIAFFGFGISKSIPVLIAFRLIQGCGTAFGNACCLAMVANMLPKDKYTTGIGYYSLAQAISQAIGPSIGLWLVGLVDYQMTFAINAGFMLIAAVMALLLKYDFTRTKKLKLSFQNLIAKEAIIPSVVSFLLIAGTTVTSFLIVFAAGQGVTKNIGLYYTVSAVTMLVTRPLVGKLVDKAGLIRVCVPALLCNVASFIVISFSTNLWGFLIASFIAAFGSGACLPAMQALCMKSVPGERRGAASSTNFIGLDLGGLVGPSIAGVVAQSFGYVTMWRVMVIPFILSALTLVIFRRRVVEIEENFV